MKWTKLKVHVNPMAVEALSDAILGLGIEGIEIEDNFLSDEDKVSMHVSHPDPSMIPYDEYRVVAYLDDTMDVEYYKHAISTEVERLKDFLPVGSGAITLEVMPDEDYENKWKDHYKPFRVGDNLVITPIWEEPDYGPEDMVIKIDPGLAFGSGTHETTSLCVETLLQLDIRGKRIVDVGCGSGILGIIAAKSGADEVIGIDIDDNAVKIAKENLVSNNVQDKMTVYQGNLLDNVQGKAQIVMANILADVIMFITPDVKLVLDQGGHFIASGILVSRVDEVLKTLEEQQFKVVQVLEKGEWAAILSMKQ